MFKIYTFRTKMILALFLGFLTITGYAQNYNITNGSISACSGDFYDSGGSGGTYSNNETFVFTICPSASGSRVRVNFTTFDLENSFDFLEIFDGASTTAPSLGTYTGVAGPGITQATINNATGCLTFRFTSDGSVMNAGWAAVISCATPCQTITANLTSTVPAAGGDGIIRICEGGSVTFNGSATFSSSGAGATYTWDFGNGTVIGTSATWTYATEGSYAANLIITDSSGCTIVAINQQVLVSTTPIITTSATPDPICLGQTSAFTATVTPVPIALNCTSLIVDTTFLPDGTGVSYSTSMPVSCFASGQTITAGNQIQDICLAMEHSYLGDLTIELICPNGQSMILKDYPGGGGTYLGEALDDVTTNPGVGTTYCFTPTATTLLINGPTVTAGNPLGVSIAPGNYMPVQSFNNLIGCPMNGNWTIQVTDNLAIDNGYIFSWGLNFSNSLTPVVTPTIVSQGWVSTAGLTSTSSTTANVSPGIVGTPCYTYSVTDNFGCTYTANQCVTVDTNANGSVLAPTLSCGVPATPSSSILLEWGQMPGATSWEYSLDSGLTWTAVALQDTSLLLTGLLSGYCVDIWVRASGTTCAVNAAAYATCCTFVLRYGITKNGITLTADESGPDITYQWIDCNGNTPIAGETGQSFTPTANGNYAVIISDGINTITTACESVNILNNNQLQSNLNVILYPNPTTGLLHLDKNNDTGIAVKITDNVGRIVLTTILKDAKNTIDLKDCPTGIYFISLDNGKNIMTQKIVKQ